MPSPLIIEIAVEPSSRKDRAAFSDALHRLLNRDASLEAVEDEQYGQTIIRARDERQLDVAVSQLQLDTAGRLKVGAPQVAYRETLAKKVDVDYTYKKQSGGSGEFGRIKFTVEPGERGQGMIFKDEVKGGNVPKEYIPSVEKGIREATALGSLTGFPIIDFTATLYDGAYHDLDSSVLAFELAGRDGMREAAQKAGIKLLEPIMRVVVLTPRRWLSNVVSGLARRQGALEHQGDGDVCVVVALAPLSQLFGYEAAVMAESEGEARSAMLLDHYDEVPPDNRLPDDTFPAAAALRA